MPGFDAGFLQAIADPRRPEHDSTRRWAGGGHDPDAFDPNAVVFDHPRTRWEGAVDQRGQSY
jgi:hypothetical protein